MKTRITLTPHDLNEDGRNTPFADLNNTHFNVKTRTMYIAEYVEYRNGNQILVLKDRNAPEHRFSSVNHPQKVSLKAVHTENNSISETIVVVAVHEDTPAQTVKEICAMTAEQIRDVMSNQKDTRQELFGAHFSD